ncbi:ROK family transcriptional regulator [Roseateles koreensis]|uniref:ROK family transcriptional regulator n=1 Tax=Roseateles koreensis TaxID=2987526 RepID=A0ABT5KVV5_9BURK|nr:ROK family transcriptional regulator [Roseateles koreensis]MDC8787069.1 ROK family transcriptional regulator [Roseateles koreensis]
MLTDTAGSQQLLKGINRMALVRHLCANPGVSRADLAVAVRLTKSTVSLLVRELLDEGWLVERDIVASGDLGRRPTPLFIHPSRLLLLGAEVGIDTTRVVATSLTGEILASTVSRHGANNSAKACIAGLSAALLKVRKQLESAEHQIIGIGVGLPGGVDELSGVLNFAPNLGWRDVPFGTLLGEKLASTALAGIPMFLQNEADVAVLGEMEFNPSRASDPLLYVSVNQGVGAGVIVGDRLLTGWHGFAGEVGHIILQLNGPLCSCGRKGCAEALIGLRAMSRGADKSEKSDKVNQGEAAQTAPTASGESPWAAIQRGLQARDTGTMRAVKKAGTYLGVLLQNLTAAYDPACIVLGGAGVELGDGFVQPALQTLNAYAAAANLAPPDVRVSRFGADAVAVGAAALARYRLTRPLAAPAFSGTAGA